MFRVDGLPRQNNVMQLKAESELRLKSQNGAECERSVQASQAAVQHKLTQCVAFRHSLILYSDESNVSKARIELSNSWGPESTTSRIHFLDIGASSAKINALN